MRLMAISIALCVLAFTVFSWTAWKRSEDQRHFRDLVTQTNQLAKQNRVLGKQTNELAMQTNHALCTFKNDLKRRYDDSVEFLEKHPNGIPGISGADIQRSLSNQKATLDALASLECPTT
jgi:hypothetical protein